MSQKTSNLLGALNNSGIQRTNPPLYQVISQIITQLNAINKAASIDSNSVISLPFGQLAFPAVQNISSFDNVLDDYREGVWTPIDGSGAGLTFTITGRPQYIKIGQFVLCSSFITYPITANGANVIIGGLPFTAQSVSNIYPAIIAYSSSGITFTGIVIGGSNTFQLANNAGVLIINSQLSNSIIVSTAIYRATQ